MDGVGRSVQTGASAAMGCASRWRISITAASAVFNARLETSAAPGSVLMFTGTRRIVGFVTRSAFLERSAALACAGTDSITRLHVAMFYMIWRSCIIIFPAPELGAAEPLE